MIVRLDAQLPAVAAKWLAVDCGCQAHHIAEFGLREATDETIFWAARAASVALLTKDADFLVLVERLGPPPAVILLKCGNLPNSELRPLLERSIPAAVEFAVAGQSMVEVD